MLAYNIKNKKKKEDHDQDPEKSQNLRDRASRVSEGNQEGRIRN